MIPENEKLKQFAENSDHLPNFKQSEITPNPFTEVSKHRTGEQISDSSLYNVLNSATPIHN
jgi:hypothetical protein